MNSVLRICLHAIYAVGLLLLVAFSGSKYDWLTDVDPSVVTGAIEDGSGNRAVISGVLVVLVVLAQLIIAIGTKSTVERIVSVSLILLAVLVYVV